MTKTKLLLGVAALVLAAGLSACYPPEDDSASAATDSGATATTTATTNQAAADASAQARADAGAAASEADEVVGPGPGQPTVAAAQAMDETAQRAIPSARLASETQTGTVTGFTMGDYFYVNGTANGRDASWSLDGVDSDGLHEFLIAHQGRPLTLSVETHRVWVSEGGMYRDSHRITAARAGDLTSAAWWARVSRDPAEQARWRRAVECTLSSGVEPPPEDADCPALLARRA